MTLEQTISDFTEKHFWSKIGGVRNNDTQLQFRGVDYILPRRGKTLFIDEKAKVYGQLNKILKYPSFELSFKNKLGAIQRGWFLREDSMTDFYAFISVFSSATGCKLIEEENIKSVRMLIVSKRDIQDLITNDIEHDAETLRDFTDLKLEAGEVDVERRKKYGHGVYWLTYSYSLNERPINLVIPRDTILTLQHTIQFNVSKDKIQRIEKVVDENNLV